MASALFNVYLHSSNKGKKQIDDEINKVLMGTQKLEDIFDKYEITPERGTNIIKRQIKTLNKKKYTYKRCIIFYKVFYHFQIIFLDIPLL